MHSDPIADMATRIRNAQMARHTQVRLPYSKVKEMILELLVAKTYIKSVQVVKEGKFEELLVTFNAERPNLHIQRVSTPGHRIYRAADELRPFRRGYGIYVVSTSKGVIAGYEAHKAGVGGEVMLEVY